MSAEQPQQPVENRVRVRRAPRDVQIDRKYTLDPVARLRMILEYTARNRAGAAGDDELRFGDCFIGLEQRFPHVRGDRTGDQNTVGVARRGHEFDAEAAGVEDDIAERIDLDLAAVAAAGADLAQAQRSPEQSSQLPAERLDRAAADRRLR